MKTKTALSTAFGLLMAGATVLASAADMPVIKPLRGVIEDVSSNALTFKTRTGAQQTIGLTDKTGVVRASKADLASIKTDSFVGSAAIPQSNGTLKALEVTVFDARLKGSGEGHYGWENADGSTGTMTNGTVGKLSSANGRTLTVNYKGGEKQLVVPDDVPIAFVEPGSAAELVKGAKVVVFPAEDGKNARGIAVGKDGFQPPM
ncbi:TPA: hypothetical protein SMR47_004012 [Pseudomonas putida]|uniref:hypothetical protein n=1 Tax=Pseudomonas putida TaxID=303 RepID=UPI000F7B66A0|nr:hypothetical protein [Pseudomonas putida]RSC27014.1 hypothetical protein EGT09_11580 [Pseudomonas putida]HEK1770046.1 hypothetical protein [Pseudomonas putida]